MGGLFPSPSVPVPVVTVEPEDMPEEEGPQRRLEELERRHRDCRVPLL